MDIGLSLLVGIEIAAIGGMGDELAAGFSMGFAFEVADGL